MAQKQITPCPRTVGGEEFGSRDSLVEHLDDQVGWKPYNASAPRADGDWVFEYEPVGDEVLEELCSEELEKMGWI